MAVLLAHFAIGVALWMLCRGWGDMNAVAAAGIVYALFERVQGYIGDRSLYWDSVLDWTGVMLGSVAAMMIWQHNSGMFATAIVSLAIVSIAGGLARS
ncbi:hypothetical protein [Paracoccus homiensis]|nr:hypothetical protein [Paracoccus homiensis]